MNATVWETLTDFIMYLGRTGKCEVDETEKGWFLTYIDRDPVKLREAEIRAKRERAELDSDERYLKEVDKMVKVARQDGTADAPTATEVLRGGRLLQRGGLERGELQHRRWRRRRRRKRWQRWQRWRRCRWRWRRRRRRRR